MYSAPFIVHALPRSRTAWLSKFLSYRDWDCHHEAAIRIRSIEDLRSLFSLPNIGFAETAAANGWRILAHHVPNLKTVVIRRPAEDAVRSMLAVDISGIAVYDEAKLLKVMQRTERQLDILSAQPGVLTVDYADLDRREACAAIFEHCLPYKMPLVWYEGWRHMNVQVDVKSVLIYYHENKPAIEAFKRTCMSELRRLAYAGLASNRK